MPIFAVEIKISTGQDVEFPRDLEFSQVVTLPQDATRFTHMRNLIVYMVT